MSASLRDSFADIKKLTPELNRLTDEAAQTVALVEKMLAETGVGMATEVKAGRVDQCDLRLGYERLAGRFRLVVSGWQEVADEDGKSYEKRWEKGWTDCARAEKLTAFKALPALLQQIAEEERRAIAEMTGTAETIRVVMEAAG